MQGCHESVGFCDSEQAVRIVAFWLAVAARQTLFGGGAKLWVIPSCW
jgi:hypothetical protein